MNKPKRLDRVIERQMDNELVLYDSQTDRTFLLNHVSAAIWDLCDGTNTIQDIAREISIHFHTPEQTVLDDAMAAIRKFLAEGILVEAGESGR